MSETEKTLSIIKPDAVERNLIDNIKKFLLIITYTLKKVKKFKSQKMKQLNFIRSINQNHFIMIYVHIYPLDLYL